MEQKHHSIAAMLVEYRFSGLTQDELGKRCGINRKTLYHYRESPEFKAYYDELLREKLSNIEDCPYAHRVDRINEMYRLYLKVEESKTSDIRTKVEILEKIAKEAEEGKIDEAAELVALLRRELAAIQGVSPGSH